MIWIAAIALCAVLSVALPLATYTSSLAAFGLVHVFSELRYVKNRFGDRIAQKLQFIIIALLLGVVAIRVLALGQAIELAFVFLLSAVALPELLKRGFMAGIIGLAACAIIFFGLLTSPAHTLLAFAVLHNLTPIGFIHEAVPRERKLPVLALTTTVFIVLPIWIASGVPFELLGHFGMAFPDHSIFPVGPLSRHFAAYLPASFHHEAWAMHAFSGIVFAQCMHYGAVIHVMPKLGTPHPDPLPLGAREIKLPIAVALVSLAFFAFDFFWARWVYGIFAAVHAWVEIPVLLIGLTPAQKLTGQLQTMPNL